MKNILLMCLLCVIAHSGYSQKTEDSVKISKLGAVLRERDLSEKYALYEEYMQISKGDTGAGHTMEMERLYISMAGAYKEADSVQQFYYFASKVAPTKFAFSYFDYAKKIIANNKDLDYAKKFAFLALEGNKNQDKGRVTGIDSIDRKAEERRLSIYAEYADLCAQICYITKDYKKGYPYAKEAAVTISKDNDWAYNEHYALLVAKVKPVADAKKELERLFKTGMLTAKGKTALQEVYVKQKKTTKGYDAYSTKLESEVASKGKAQLKKIMENKKAPGFTLLNMQGETVSLSALKGKVVVIDFWATWCVPCISAFPAMKETQVRFKNNKDVVFLFINTKEQKGYDVKEKITKLFMRDDFKTFDFNVVLDEGKITADSFGVKGIPAKFIIDPQVIIRFSTMGYDGKKDALVEELSLMIEMAAEAGKS